ncbi:hypothetical protein Taro_001377 [Colocasia esculenta]|uniref:Uncharacterized protein n=1 Tax=Colocasia esculenta TaxID=4460 RepID=A0A843THJ6_COLES|nr:hypothetical protein [Colocasia esculenta]
MEELLEIIDVHKVDSIQRVSDEVDTMVCWCADSGRIGLALMRSDSPRIGANRPDSPGNCWAVMVEALVWPDSHGFDIFLAVSMFTTSCEEHHV